MYNDFLHKEGTFGSLFVACDIVFPVVLIHRSPQIESVTIALIFKIVGWD